MRYPMICLALAACISAVALDLKDPFVGTWKLDTATVKNNWGEEPAKSTIRTYMRNDKGVLIYKAETIRHDGTPRSVTGPSQTDEVQQIPKGATGFFAATGVAQSRSKKITAFKSETTYLDAAGKKVAMGYWDISHDGKTLTHRVKGKSTDGKDLEATEVFTRQ